MNNIRKYLDDYYGKRCPWDENELDLPKNFTNYTAVALSQMFTNPTEVERLKLLYQIYKDAGDYTIDSLDSISEKISVTNHILNHRDITKEVHMGVSHALADMLKLGGVKELLEKIAEDTDA